MAKRNPTQAMPHDGLKGSDDGTNQPTAHGRSAGSHDSSYPNPHSGNGDPQFPKRGGQTGIGYHGSGQLGEKIIKPGGNGNAGANTAAKISGRNEYFSGLAVP